MAEKSLVSNIKKGLAINPGEGETHPANPHMVTSLKPVSDYASQSLMYPTIDMSKLSQEQQDEINFYISQIQRLEKEHRQIRTQSVKTISSQYEKQRKTIEMEHFFKECVKASEKEIMKSHEISQLN